MDIRNIKFSFDQLIRPVTCSKQLEAATRDAI